MVKKTKKQGNNYFTKETEDAIVKYNNTEDYITRNKIYENYIHYPLFKLTQNIIHTFKFYHTEVEDLEHLQHELIIFVLSKFHLFNPAKSVEKKISDIIIENDLNIPKISFQEWLKENRYDDHTFTLKTIKDYIENQSEFPEESYQLFTTINIPKAYSYFGTIVKRWLILYNNKNYNNKIQNVPIYQDSDDNSPDYLEDNVGLEADEETYSENLETFMDQYIDYCTENINIIFPKKQDAQIADAILEIFRSRQNIDVFNKKALYIYIREMIDIKTPKITKIANQLYDIFKHNYVFYLENDYINFED